MMKIKSWIKAFRLRTLPLALSSILMGSFLAVASNNYSSTIIILSLITTLFLQILSNLANDYGDGMKGTDNENRLGPTRTIQSGEISPAAMRLGIVVFVIISLVSGIWLIYEALGSDWWLGIIFLSLGLASIAAALKYTMGKKSYGYSGFGDLFVFIFFGIVAVLGTYFLNTLIIDYKIILPAISMGMLSTAVLNLNNMRDLKNDLTAGKTTLASVMGREKSKIYHNSLIILAMISSISYTIITYTSIFNLIYLIVIPLFIIDLIKINKISNEQLLDPYLKATALKTLLFTILFGLGLII